MDLSRWRHPELSHSLLLELAKNLRKDDIEKIVFLYRLPPASFDGLTVLLKLEMDGIIDRSEPSTLKNILEKIGRNDLVIKVDRALFLSQAVIPVVKKKKVNRLLPAADDVVTETASDSLSLTLPKVVSVLVDPAIKNWRTVVAHLGVPKGESDNVEQAVTWWMFSGERASWNDLADALCEADYENVAAEILTDFLDLKFEHPKSAKFALLPGKCTYCKRMLDDNRTLQEYYRDVDGLILCDICYNMFLISSIGADRAEQKLCTIMRCNHKRSGCDWIGTLKRYLEEHRKECECRPVKCPNEKKGCKISISFKDLRAHAEECDYRLVSCLNASRGCTRKLLAQEMEQHVTKFCSFQEEEPSRQESESPETLEFCDHIEKHMQRSGCIYRYLAHLVFVGLPGSGKSTLIARLLKLAEVEEMLKACASTGVMNGIITVDVAEDAASFHSADIVNEGTKDTPSSRLVSECDWEKVEYGISCLRQMGVGGFVPTMKLHDATQEGDQITGTQKDDNVEGHTTDVKHEDRVEDAAIGGAEQASLHTEDCFTESATVLEDQADIHDGDPTFQPYKQLGKARKKPSTRSKRVKKMADVKIEQRHTAGKLSLETIRTLLREKGFSAVRPFLNNKCSLYLSDTGGQIEFQELLPLLVAGRAIFIFLFPLNLDLNKTVRISYRKRVADGKIKHSNVYTSSLTIKESFLQTLASIDSMEGFVDPSIAKHKPYVFVIGTHKDCLIEKLGEENAVKRISAIDNEIKSLIKEHKYEDLVVYADKITSQVIFAVDNTCENNVFGKIRARVMDLIHSSDEFRIKFPLSYLLASLDLQASYEPFIRRKEFARNVLQYGIESESIDHLLQFLHSRIGQIRYFPVKEIREVIVREPQALFNLVTYLIVRSFLSQAVTMAKHSEVQKGIYSIDSFELDEFLTYAAYITPKQVIQLLKELRIVAPFFDQKAGTEKYFLPCVLNHLMESPKDDKKSIIQPLAIMFDCGHCPKGMFGVLLHFVVTRKNRRLEWNLDIGKIFRDQVSFEVGPYGDSITLKFCTTHLEVSCHPLEVTQRDGAFSIEKICNTVRSQLASGIEQATVSLHYSREKTQHSFGLVCEECSVSHKVVKVGVDHVISDCSQRCYHPLPESGSFWFGSVPVYSFLELEGKRDILSLKEGSSHQMEFSSAPSPEQHFLSKENGSVEENRVYIESSSVQFCRVKRSDAGRYTVSSTNAAGQGQGSFHLRVKYPPTYSLDPDYIQAAAGTSPTVAFSVTSYPPLAQVRHTLKREDTGKVARRFKVEENVITFRNVRETDSGTYVISCCNDDGEEGEETLELDVLPNTAPGAGHTPAGSDTQTVVKNEDIPFLMDFLCEYAYKWMEIGEALNFSDGELRTIRYDHPSAAQQCLTTLLNQWSYWPTRRHPEEPTMERLRDALSGGWVGLGAMAKEVYDMRSGLPSQP